MENHISALILGQPGPLREGLRTILQGVPLIGTVHQAEDLSSALEIIGERRPALVLLDGRSVRSGLPAVLTRLRDERIPSWCLVLADNIQQKKEAESAGAHLVLLEGFPAGRLREIIKQLAENVQQG